MGWREGIGQTEEGATELMGQHQAGVFFIGRPDHFPREMIDIFPISEYPYIGMKCVTSMECNRDGSPDFFSGGRIVK